MLYIYLTTKYHLIRIIIVCLIYIQVWAVFGEPRGVFGRSLVCFLHRWAMQGDSHLTPYIKRCVQVSPTHTHPIRRGRSPLEKWHSDTLEYAFQHIYCSQINALPQPLPKHSLCSELPRMHRSLLDPQPLPLLLCDLLVTRQFRRDDMEGGMQL